MTPEAAFDGGRPGASEPGALAFVTDADSEHALREGLAGYPDAQVWPGGLRAAVAALGRGAGSRLLFVDLDGIPYPAGAIHELAAVCEVGTAVVALGSEGSARFSREVLLAGVSDYLVKPLGAGAVREAAIRAAGAEGDAAASGFTVGFAGSGGSGTTTLAAALALVAAARGRYVSVLDLSRPWSTLSFSLDIEPAAGLEQLFETAERTDLDPEAVDAVRAQRSDRIAVYAYRFSPSPPPPAPVSAVLRLLAELKRRSHPRAGGRARPFRDPLRAARPCRPKGAGGGADPEGGGACRAPARSLRGRSAARSGAQPHPHLQERRERTGAPGGGGEGPGGGRGALRADPARALRPGLAEGTSARFPGETPRRTRGPAPGAPGPRADREAPRRGGPRPGLPIAAGSGPGGGRGAATPIGAGRPWWPRPRSRAARPRPT